MKKLDPRLVSGAVGAAALTFIAFVLGRHIPPHPAPRSASPPPARACILDTLYPFIASPNYNARPARTQINCIVLHATGGVTRRGVLRTFLNPQSRTSAHYIIFRDGNVVQMVRVEQRAWHAGRSALDGVYGVNDYSIGIEMVNRDDGREPYTPAQYSALARLIDRIRLVYPIPIGRIVSHAQVALPPGRKSDPAGFSFPRLYRCMAALEAPAKAQ